MLSPNRSLYLRFEVRNLSRRRRTKMLEMQVTRVGKLRFFSVSNGLMDYFCWERLALAASFVLIISKVRQRPSESEPYRWTAICRRASVEADNYSYWLNNDQQSVSLFGTGITRLRNRFPAKIYMQKPRSGNLPNFLSNELVFDGGLKFLQLFQTNE